MGCILGDDNIVNYIEPAEMTVFWEWGLVGVLILSYVHPSLLKGPQ